MVFIIIKCLTVFKSTLCQIVVSMRIHDPRICVNLRCKPILAVYSCNIGIITIFCNHLFVSTSYFDTTIIRRIQAHIYKIGIGIVAVLTPVNIIDQLIIIFFIEIEIICRDILYYTYFTSVCFLIVGCGNLG